MIAAYERVQNIWLKKLLYERERMIMTYRGKYAEENILNERRIRLERIERLIKLYGDNCIQMKDYNGDEWIKADKSVKEYPLGTKFKALMGGYWIRVERGFKWCTGATFPNVGGDWTGEVCLPS